MKIKNLKDEFQEIRCVKKLQILNLTNRFLKITKISNFKKYEFRKLHFSKITNFENNIFQKEIRISKITFFKNYELKK